MRPSFFMLVCVLFTGLVCCAGAGEKKVKGGGKKDKEVAADDDSDKAKDKDKGKKNAKDGDKDKDKDKEKGKDKDKSKEKDKKSGKEAPGQNKEQGRIPPGIAKQGQEKIDKWLNSRGQLNRDLDEIYDRDPARSRDKDSRKAKADALYEALTDKGMDSDEARKFINRMAGRGDKDNAYDAVRKSLDDARSSGIAGDRAVSDVTKIVDGAESAAAIGDGLRKWLRK